MAVRSESLKRWLVAAALGYLGYLLYRLDRLLGDGVDAMDHPR